MTAHFKHTSKRNLGYDPVEVDQVIAEARGIFANLASSIVEDSFIRNAQFSLVKGGYDIAAVDAALDRLDDAISAQSAKNQVSNLGLQSTSEQVASLRETLVARIKRKKGQNFKHAGLLRKGYHKGQVQATLKNIDAHLEGHARLTVQQLRDVRFKSVWGGYDEKQVDAFLDRTIDFVHLEQALAAAPRW